MNRYSHPPGEVLGAWIPKRRLLNLFLKKPYTLVADGKIVAKAPGEGFFKLFVSGFIRNMMAHKVVESATLPRIRLMCKLAEDFDIISPINQCEVNLR